MYVCSLCNRFRGSNFAAVLRHIGNTHRFDPGFFISCGLRFCPATYTNYESFRSHVYRKHRDELFVESNGCTPDSHSEEADSSLLDWEGTADISNDEHPKHSTEPLDDMKLHAAKFILRTKEECKLTQTSVDAVLSSVKGLWGKAMENLRSKLSDYLPEEIDQSCFSSPFDGLETRHLQQKYYQENFNYVVSW